MHLYSGSVLWDFACVIELRVAICNIVLKLEAVLNC
jgi:hypothetical protein